MTTNTLTIIVSVLTLFTFLAIWIPILKRKATLKNNKILLIASFALFISNSALSLDLQRSSILSPSFILTFICYSAITLCFVLLLTLIASLYLNTIKPKYYILVLFSIFIGVLYGLLAVNESDYFLSNVLYGLALSIPVFITVHIMLKQKVHLFKNVFFYQFIILGILCLMKIINLRFYDLNSNFIYHSNLDILFNMFSVILIVTMFTSYLFENQSIMIDKLKSNKFLLESSLSKLKILSETDQLTGLSNRHKIENDLNILCNNFKKNNIKFSIFMCDIDNFKAINDTYGHNRGDDVLKFTSKLLVRLLKPNGIVGRWGGDEFIVLLPKTNKTIIENTVKKIHSAFKEELLSNKPEHVSLSIGFATIDDNIKLKELLHTADSMMYFNKSKLK